MSASAGLGETLDKEIRSIFGFWKRRREKRVLAETDANGLIARFGEQAYPEARSRVIEARCRATIDGNRGQEHRDRVRQIIERKTGRRHVDTATRCLKP